tara:strand:- start:5095 stop:5358 length:264 start_codon:yes stop_codon:yes gene_type:complete
MFNIKRFDNRVFLFSSLGVDPIYTYDKSIAIYAIKNSEVIEKLIKIPADKSIKPTLVDITRHEIVKKMSLALLYTVFWTCVFYSYLS